MIMFMSKLASVNSCNTSCYKLVSIVSCIVAAACLYVVLNLDHASSLRLNRKAEL